MGSIFTSIDPRFTGENEITSAYSNSTLVVVGSSDNNWRDDTIDASFNTLVTRSTEHSLISSTPGTGIPDGCVRIEVVGLTSGKAVFSDGGLTVGREYQVFSRFLLPSSTVARPAALLIDVGSTPGSYNWGRSPVEALTLNPLGEEWAISPVCTFIAEATTGYFTFGVISSNVSGDHIFIDGVMCLSKYEDWDKD